MLPCSPGPIWGVLPHPVLPGLSLRLFPNRNGAPEDVRFDTEEEAWSWAEEILSVTTSTPPRMPPEGGVHEDDQQKLTWWLDCN